MHELETLLGRLKMEHLGYQVESLLEQAAKEELNYREFLCRALQQEWSGRHQRGMESRLPWVKTLEQFDFSFQPGIDRKVVRELTGLVFVERSENVILLGPAGVGKTHWHNGLKNMACCANLLSRVSLHKMLLSNDSTGNTGQKSWIFTCSEH